ncbi:putative transcriptional regulator [Salirhabdus euzebyi]|uniref:Putative transcriptional regulator n=1 Tax=Salirhabdus euzebyi TaxID=394506 RepID=A0A841Q7K2_9BACI|nr:helix-turn-helix domain-containing protein [Salirhabdus euzebyi]MBB6454400.1 putative transcriptional regulator [Salirhabdus euzebyi]
MLSSPRIIRIPNEETGEIEEYFLAQTKKFELIDKEKKEMIKRKFQRKKGIRIKDIRGEFLMAKSEPLKRLEETDITVKDRRYFMQLLTYLDFGQKPLKKGDVPLNINEIAKIWGMHKDNAKVKINKLVDIGLVIKDKDPIDKRRTVFLINSEFYEKGKKSSSDKFVKVFQKKLAEVISNIEEIQKNSKNQSILNSIGLLNALIPYFHYQTFYLVENPNECITLDGESIIDALERNSGSLRHLTKTRLCSIIGNKNGNRNTITQYFKILEKAGAVMVLNTNRKSTFLIHPDLFFRIDSKGVEEYTRYVRTMFNQHNSVALK